MYTLQEFIRFTKGWEYIIAIVAVFLFIAFWEVLAGTFFPKEDHQGKDDLHHGAGN